ncbi:hypothetical protein BMF94_6857 [Rhodotorula taiwanensis]|uniref:Uncharacterized protein n=1 Tax=Rhodotorula taiwanensis TaxID=741276 RepID=A0A2S5B037_9BASI|nr:hypothetical protein BMF94_6857 [Rhodotorula taiwanensis]
MPSQLPYIICTALNIVLNAGPLVWQFKQGNSGPIAMGVWTMIASINELVNTTVWYNDADDKAPIWCDISVKLAIGQQVGRVAAVFCIARFLADIVSPRATAITRSDRRKRALYDYTVSFGVPAIAMACSALYQPYRYRITRGVGCGVPVVSCWPVLSLRVIWPPVFAIGGMLYSLYTVYRLLLHRRDFRRVVAGSHSALTTTRFLRLTALSLSYLCIGMPLAFVSAVQYVRSSGPYSDYSWEYIHSGWDVYGIPRSNEPSVADFVTWSNVIVAFFFFAAFGFGGESSAALKKLLRVDRLSRFLPHLGSPSQSGTSATSAPSYEIGKDVGFSRGIKVTVEEDCDVV